MKADKRILIIGIMILLGLSMSAYALDIPEFGGLTGLTEFVGLGNFGGGFGKTLGVGFVNGGLIFIAIAIIMNAFSMMDKHKPESGAIMYALMFAGSLAAAIFLFGSEFLWKAAIIANNFDRFIIVNSLVIFIVGFLLTNYIPFFKNNKPSSKGANFGLILVMIVGSVFIAKYLGTLYPETYLHNMKWVALLLDGLKNFPVFLGMSLIYYFVFSTVVKDGMGKSGNIVLACVLGFQSALNPWWDLNKVFQTGYWIALLVIYQKMNDSGKPIACGMSFSIANMMGSVVLQNITATTFGAEYPVYFWVNMPFPVSFAMGVGIGWLWSRATDSDKAKMKNDREALEKKEEEERERWQRKHALAMKGLLRRIETADPKVIEYLRKDMDLLNELVRRKEIIEKSGAVSTPIWNNLMYGTQGNATRKDYEERYLRLDKAIKQLVDSTSVRPVNNKKDIKEEVERIEDDSKDIDKEKDNLLKGNIKRRGHAITVDNPTYSKNEKSIMGIIWHADLVIRMMILKEQEKEQEALIEWKQAA